MPSPGTDMRVLVTAGMTVARLAVYARLRSDDTIEMLGLDVDES